MEIKNQQAIHKAASLQAEIRKTCSRVALIMTLVIIIAFAMQFVVSMVIQTYGRITNDTLRMIIVSFVSMYVIALPIGAFLLIRTAKGADGYEQFGIKQMICFILMGEGLSYVGNLIGTILANFFSNRSAVNPVVSVAEDNGNVVVKIISMVLIVPLLEEVVFRKLIVDNVRRLDEKTAVVFSALVFALYHINLYQFFYTAAIGLLWAYAYLRTGKIRYSYLLHVILNFKGIIISGMISSGSQLNIIEGLQTTEEIVTLVEQKPEIVVGIVVFLAYAFINLIIVVIGIVLLIRNRKKWIFKNSLSRECAGCVDKNMLFNTGTVVYAVICITLMGVQLINR